MHRLYSLQPSTNRMNSHLNFPFTCAFIWESNKCFHFAVATLCLPERKQFWFAFAWISCLHPKGVRCCSKWRRELVPISRVHLTRAPISNVHMIKWREYIMLSAFFWCYCHWKDEKIHKGSYLYRRWQVEFLLPLQCLIQPRDTCWSQTSLT